MKKRSLSILFITGIIAASSYFFINTSISTTLSNRLYSLLRLSKDQKEFIKKYILPYKLIEEQAKENSNLITKLRSITPLLAELELYKKNSGEDIAILKSSIELQKAPPYYLKNLNLEKYKLTSGFYSGINNYFPGSGYLDFHNDDLIIASSRGVLAFSKNFPSNEIIFKQIKNNIDEFINLNQYKKSTKFSIKDLLIFNKNIYLSYTEEISDDCFNTSIIYGKIDYQNIKFDKLFSSKECIHSTKNLDNEFQVHQSGGRLVPLDDKNIIFSIGEYRSRHLAQNISSVNGKLIKINLIDGNYKVISMGHRNPQGLYFDKENNFLLETEHGPMGGDEINLLREINSKKENVYNFGWPIASAGEHYGGRMKENKKKYEKYPLYKSHSDYGFLEPLKSFVPSIGISEVVKIGEKNYVVSSLKDKSLYFFEIKDSSFIKNITRLEIGERIRDLKFKNNNLIMFLEDTASIGILNLRLN